MLTLNYYSFYHSNHDIPVYCNHDPRHFREKLVFSVAIHLFLDWLPGFLNKEGHSILKFNGNPGQPVVHFFRHWEGDRNYNFIPKTTPPGAGLIHNMTKAAKDPLIAANEKINAGEQDGWLHEIGCGIRREDIPDYEAFYDNDVTKVVPAFYRFSWFLNELLSNRIEVEKLVKFAHHVEVARYPDDKSESSDSDGEEEWEDPDDILNAADDDSVNANAANESNVESGDPVDTGLSRNASNTSSVSTRTPRAKRTDGSKDAKRRLTDREKLQRDVDRSLAMEKRKGRWLGSVINATTNVKSKTKVPATVTRQHVIDILPFLFENDAIKKISFDKEVVSSLFMKGGKELEELDTIFRIRSNYDDVMKAGHEAQGKINELYNEKHGFSDDDSDEEEEKVHGRTSPENKEEADKEAGTKSPARKKHKPDTAAGVSDPVASQDTPKKSDDVESTRVESEATPDKEVVAGAAENKTTPKTPATGEGKMHYDDGLVNAAAFLERVDKKIDKEAEEEKKGGEKKKTNPAKSAKKKKTDPPRSAKKKKKETPLLNSPFGKKDRNKKTAIYFPNDTLTEEFKDAFKQRGIKHFKPQFRSNLQEPIRYEFEEQEDLDAFNDIWSNCTAAIGNVVIGLKKKEDDNVS